MREIKFRLWSPEMKVMMSDFGPDFDDPRVNITFKKYSEMGQIVMQFTGLKDKNGKEIYEGDIGTWSDVKDVVSWNNGGFWQLGRYGFQNIQIKDFEIIGNTYENPELLK